MNRQHKLCIAIASVSLLPCFRSGALLAQSRNGSLSSNAPSAQPAQKLVENWISKDATYKLSSKNAYHEPLPAFLTGEEGLHLNEFAFHTAEGVTGGYVTIDLGKAYPISKIWIEFRRHGSAARAKGLSVWLSNTEGTKGDKVWTADKFAPEWTVEVKNVQARYVTIGLPDTLAEPLHLAHAKVFAMLSDGSGRSASRVGASSTPPGATTQPLQPVVQHHATPELIEAYRASQIGSVDAEIKAISGTGGSYSVLDSQLRSKRKQLSQLIDAPDQTSRSSRRVQNTGTDNVDVKRQLQTDIKDLQAQQTDLANQVRDLNAQKLTLQKLSDAKIAAILNEQFRQEALAQMAKDAANAAYTVEEADAWKQEKKWESTVTAQTILMSTQISADEIISRQRLSVTDVLQEMKQAALAGKQDESLKAKLDYTLMATPAKVAGDVYNDRENARLADMQRKQLQQHKGKLCPMCNGLGTIGSSGGGGLINKIAVGDSGPIRQCPMCHGSGYVN